MNRSNQRKIQPTTLIFQHEKENSSNSDLESLLVSSVRYDQQYPTNNDYVAQPRQRLRPSQLSLIKKNIASNVYIEESNRCSCQHKIESINDSIRLFSLKLQELEVKINICFGKQASIQNLLSQNECKRQLNEFKQWEAQNQVKNDAEKAIRIQQENNLFIRELNEEIARLKKAISRLETRQTDKCLESRLVEHKLEKFKGDQQEKISRLLQSVEQIGALQQKILSNSELVPTTCHDENSFGSSYLLAPCKKLKILKGCSVGRNRTCQSTNISYSRNIDVSK